MAQLRLLTPLRRRDFALLTAGSAISLLGDGVFSVALAWQVHQISNTPSALALVYIARTLPLGVFLLFGGIVGDRVDRRPVMVATDLLARVSRVDWLMTVSLAPLSFALTGPAAELFGARPVMIALLSLLPVWRSLFSLRAAYATPSASRRLLADWRLSERLLVAARATGLAAPRAGLQ